MWAEKKKWKKKLLKPNFRIFVDKTEKSHGKQLGFLSAAINLRNFRDYENGFRLMRKKKNTKRNTTNENKTKKRKNNTQSNKVWKQYIHASKIIDG